jgi:hypothetical protein
MIKNFYYSNDGQIFNSKTLALEYARKKNKLIQFYYYDDLWSLNDWTKEPPNTLEYYYRQQAQRIRDNYDYVILCYSGGADSTNILETFYYNNIKLDKIVIVGAFKQDSSSMVDENHNGELYYNSFPYVQELGLESITQIYDYSEYFGDIKNFSVYGLGEHWVDEIGSYFSPNHWFWRDLEKYVVPPGLENKRVAILLGKDKPNLIYDKNQPGFCFRDVPVRDHGVSIKWSMESNVDRINFYWDPGYPQILIKQVHMLYRAYPKGHSDYQPVMDKNDADRIVYNLRKPLIFKSPKSPSKFFSLRDKFLLKHQSSSIFDFYKNGIQYLNKKVPFDLLSSPIRSKFYKII